MPRKTDSDDKKVHFQMDRFVQQNGEWFYETRDEGLRGPFKTRDNAEVDLVLYLNDRHRKENFGEI